MALTLTLPSARILPRRSDTWARSAVTLSNSTQSSSAWLTVSWYSSQSLAAVWSYSASAAAFRSARRAISRLISSRLSAAARPLASASVSACWRPSRCSVAWRMAASFSAIIPVLSVLALRMASISARQASLRRASAFLFSSSRARRLAVSAARCSSAVICACASSASFWRLTCSSRLALCCSASTRCRVRKASSPSASRFSSSERALILSVSAFSSAWAWAAFSPLASSWAFSWSISACRAVRAVSACSTAASSRLRSASARTRSLAAVICSLAVAVSSAEIVSVWLLSWSVFSCAARQSFWSFAALSRSSSISCLRVNSPADRWTLPPVKLPPALMTCPSSVTTLLW